MVAERSLVIKDNKEIFGTLHTAAYGAEGNFSADD